MSITGEIARINRNIASSYAECESKGAPMPVVRNSDSLSAAISGIPTASVRRYDQRNLWVGRYLDEVTYISDSQVRLTFSSNVTIQIVDPDKATSQTSGNTAVITGVSEGYTAIRATVSGQTLELGINTETRGGSPVVSCVKGYHAQHEYENWRPTPAIIPTLNGVLRVSDGDNGGVISKAVSTGDSRVYNLTPGAISSYVIESGNTAPQTGMLIPEGACRMIETENMENIRDIGGWQCDSGTVRYNKIIRGYTLYYASNADKAMLKNHLKIRRDISLQYPTDANYYDTSLLGNDVDFVHYDGDTWYGGILQNPNAGKLLGDIFSAAVEGKTQYIHCAQGADRTGTVMYIIESVLGMSESDKDKDYELTSFTAQRLRSGTDWIGLKTAVNALPGSNVRDKIVGWLITKGVSIELINAFRTAMIDGTPSELSASVATYTVTKNGSGVTYDNPANSIKQYQDYRAVVTPDTYRLITGITVTMNGVDITSASVSGDFVPFGEKTISENGTYDVGDFASAVVNVPSQQPTKYTVARNLHDSVSNNPAVEVTGGDSYAAAITPTSGHVIDSVAVTVNGVDYSSNYVYLIEED